MPITGLELNKYFDLAIDKSYSAYLDPAKKNRVFYKAYANLISKKYSSLDSQDEFDELSNVIKTEYVVNPVSNKIRTKPIQINSIAYTPTVGTITTTIEHLYSVGDTVTISDVSGIVGISGSYQIQTIPTATSFTINVSSPTGTHTQYTGSVSGGYVLDDYEHLLTIKCKFVDDQKYKNLRILSVTSGSRTIVEFYRRSSLRDGDIITISGVNGITNANGTFYVKKLSDYKVQLFSDEKLDNAISSSGTYVNGGSVLGTVYYEYAVQTTSDRKISTWETPTVYSPRFEVAENFIKLYPNNYTCSEVTFDYLTNGSNIPTVRIDVLDNQTDLELYYDGKFLMRLVEEAAAIFNKEARDIQQYQVQKTEIIDNP